MTARKTQPKPAEPEPTETPETPAQTEQPKPLTASEKKARVAQRLITAAADVIEQWNDPEVDREFARELTARLMNYAPGTFWDSRLGKPAALVGKPERKCDSD